MDALFCKKPQDTREGLLPNVFDCRNRAQTLAHLQTNQFAKVSHEVLLGAEIAGTKPSEVGTVEILKLHWHGCSSHGLSVLAFFPLPVTAPFSKGADVLLENAPFAMRLRSCVRKDKTSMELV